MFHQRKLAALSAILICFACAAMARADDMIDNPAYQSWAKHKVGTWVEYQTDSEAMGNKSSIITTQTLKKLTADTATIVIQSSMTVGGNKMDMPPQTQEITAKIKRPPAAPAAAGDAPKTDQGTEDIKVDDKTFSCKWTNVTSEQNGMKTTAKTWTCDDVPGSVVKIESSTSGSMTATMTMTLVKCEIQ